MAIVEVAVFVTLISGPQSILVSFVHHGKNGHMKDHLQFVLTTTNDWLKFGEAKNLAALAFAGTAIGAYVRAVDIINLPIAVKIFVSAGIAGLTIAGISALLSFIPTLNIPYLYSKRAPQDSDNLLFYGHIAHYQPSEFLERTEKLVGQQHHDAIDEHYAAQIITNARIALRKYRLFSAACWSGLAGIILLGVRPRNSFRLVTS
jgi:hypothetical protein